MAGSSVIGDLIEVPFSPAPVYDRRRESGVGMLLLVLAATMLVTGIATKGLLEPFFNAQFELGMKQGAARGGPAPSGEALEMARTIANWGVLAGLLLAPVFSTFVTGLFLWVGGKVVGAPMRYGQAALVVCLANVPRLFGTLAAAVQGAIMDTEGIRSFFDASLGPARFVDPMTTPPALLQLLGSLDLFNLWMLALMAIGTSVIARVSRGTGAVAAIIAWGIGTALSLIPSVLFN